MLLARSKVTRMPAKEPYRSRKAPSPDLATGYRDCNSVTGLLWTRERSWRKKVNTSNRLLSIVNTMMSSTVL